MICHLDGLADLIDEQSHMLSYRNVNILSLLVPVLVERSTRFSDVVAVPMSASQEIHLHIASK